MNNKAIINTFNSYNNNIANIKTQNQQITKNITNGILKCESMIKKLIVANYAFFNVITFSKTNFFAYINYIVIQYL